VENGRDLVGICRESIGPLYAFVSRRTGGDRALAEDVTQEACLRAVRHWRNGDFPREPGAWLKTVARNLLADHYRRHRPELLAPERVERLLAREEETTPDSAALLGWAFSGMRRGQVRLLEAFHLEGLDVRTIARDHGLGERAVEGRLRRARKALAKRLANRMKDEGVDHE